MNNSLFTLGAYKFIRRGKIKKNALCDMYMNLITLIAADEHKYKTPDFNKYTYELAINTGAAAFYLCPEKSSVNYNKWCCTPAQAASVPDNMGVCRKITTAGSDYALTLEVDKECILIYNNSALYPDYIFTHFAEQLTENDISMSKLVKWARMTPIPKAKTDSDIVKYQQALQRILDGEDINIISDEMQLFKEGHDTIDDNVLRLTDEKAVEKLHYFDEHHEQLIRRIATLGGLPFSTTAKSSQNLIDELHDMDALSTFIIKDRAACRRDGFKRAAEFMASKGYDFDFEYDLNDVLKKQLEKPAIEHKTQLAEADRITAEAAEKQAEAAKESAEAEKAAAEADTIKEGETDAEGAEDRTDVAGADAAADKQFAADNS